MKKIKTIIIFALCFAVSIYAQTVEQPIAFFPFNGNVNDESGYGHNGTIHGSPITSLDRFFNESSAYYFDGFDDYITIPHSDLLNFNSSVSSYSVSMWIKAETQDPVIGGTIIKKGFGNVTSPLYMHAIVHYLASNLSVSGIGYQISFGNVYDFTWKHIVLVIDFNSGIMKGYVNGTLFQTLTYNRSLSSSNNEQFYIGGTTNFYKGYLDDIKLFNYALSEDEINDLYSEGGFTPTQKGIKLITPNGGESWEAGTTHSITWASNGIDKVKIEYSFDDGNSWNIIASSAEITAAFNWEAPNKPSSVCKIKISDVSTPSMFDISDQVFIITKPSSKLIAYYPFTGNAYDESGNDNTGMVYGATLSTDRFEIANSAYDFDGVNDYISTFNSINWENLGLNDDMTISTWIYIDSLAVYDSSTKWSWIMNNADALSFGNYKFWAISVPDFQETLPNPDFWIFDKVEGLGYGNNQMNSFEFSKWHHLVYVLENSANLSIYVDNKKEYSVKILNNDLDAPNGRLYIGKNGNSSSTQNYYWNGKIDDIRIYNYALSNSEVNELYKENGWLGNEESEIRITDIVPRSGVPGSQITILGYGFDGIIKDNNSVYIGGNKAEIESATENKLVLKIPEVSSGSYNISIKRSSKTSISSQKITVLKNYSGLQPKFSVKKIISTGAGTEAISPEFIGADNYIDLFAAQFQNTDIAWFTNSGNKSFTSANYLENSNNYSPQDLCVSDLNYDGYVDLLVAFYEGKIVSYKNNGDLTFSTPVIIDDIDNPVIAKTADINLDGYVDILVVSALDNSIWWYQNDGEGNFGDKKIVGGSSHNISSISFSDLDKDGDLDFVVGKYGLSELSWFENDGTGAYIKIIGIADLTIGLSKLSCADIDSDGDDDVVAISAATDGYLKWYPNNADGTFSPVKTINSQSVEGRGLFTADLDGDGDSDLITATYNDSNILWYRNDGNGVFSSGIIIDDNFKDPKCVYPADIDDDGDLDIFAASYNGGEIVWYENIIAENIVTSLNLEPKSGVPGSLVQITVNGISISSIKSVSVGNAVADIINKGTNTIVIKIPESEHGLERIKIETENNSITVPGTFNILSVHDGLNKFNTDAYILSANKYVGKILELDIDNDSDIDLIYSGGQVNNGIGYNLNTGNGLFSVYQSIFISSTYHVSEVISSELNNDEFLDIIFSGNNFIGYCINTGLGGFSEAIIIELNIKSIWNLCSGDLDNDGDNDIVLGSEEDAKISWLENYGNASFSQEIVIRTGISIWGDNSLSVADIDLDSDYDIVFTTYNNTSSYLAWIENLGNLSFSSPKILYSNINEMISHYALDLDNDYDTDIIFTSLDEGKIYLLENKGDKSFESPKLLYSGLKGVRHLSVADIDNDSYVDIVAYGYLNNTSKLLWLKNKKNCQFTSPKIITEVYRNFSSITVCDIENDGDVDIVPAMIKADNTPVWLKNDLLNKKLELISPNGNEELGINFNEKIKWENENINSVDILYSINGGLNWNTIALNYSSSNSEYNWLVNSTASDNCLIKIQDNSDHSLFDESDSSFSIISSPKKLIAYYIFNNNSNDETGYGNHATHYGDVEIDTSIQITNPTSQGVFVPAGTLNGEASFTISANVRLKQLSLDKYVLLSAESIDSTRYFEINYSTLNKNWNILVDQTEFMLPENNIIEGKLWHHIIVIKEGLNIKFYFDGNLLGWKNILSFNVLYIDEGRFILGNGNSINFKPWIGELDDVRIYNYALTDAEITGIYNSDLKSEIVSEITNVIPGNDETLRAGNTAIVSWTSKNVESVKIDFSNDGGNNWIIVAPNVEAQNSFYNWLVPDLESVNCKIRITNNDNLEVFAESQKTFSIFSYPASITLQNNLTFGNIENTSSYRMVSLPGNTTKNVSSGLSGNEGIDWTAYYDNGISESFIKYDGTSTFSFSPGKGFWLISKNGWNVNENNSSVLLSDENTFSIPLHAGWNIIGNPFNKTISWSSVKSLNGISENIYYYSGSYSIAENFEPYKGFYFYNVDGKLELKIPFIDKTSSLPKVTSGQSFISINLYNENNIVSSIEIGYSDSSAIGYDKLDKFAPPGNFENERLTIYNDTLKTPYKYLYKDFRKSIGDLQSYKLFLKNSLSKSLELEFEGIEKLPTGTEVYLFDTEYGISYDLSIERRIQIQKHNLSKEFLMLIGSAESIQKVIEKMLPANYNLFQNYPNPFNPSTKIKFSIPENTYIKLEVYNVLGERVDLLIDQLLNAGFHEVNFNSSGLSSGVYFYKLTSARFSTVKKMIFLK